MMRLWAACKHMCNGRRKRQKPDNDGRGAAATARPDTPRLKCSSAPARADTPETSGLCGQRHRVNPTRFCRSNGTPAATREESGVCGQRHRVNHLRACLSGFLVGCVGLPSGSGMGCRQTNRATGVAGRSPRGRGRRGRGLQAPAPARARVPAGTGGALGDDRTPRRDSARQGARRNGAGRAHARPERAGGTAGRGRGHSPRGSPAPPNERPRNEGCKRGGDLRRKCRACVALFYGLSRVCAHTRADAREEKA